MDTPIKHAFNLIVNKIIKKIQPRKKFNLIVKSGHETTPTPDMLEKFMARNLTGHQKSWIGVVAHEIGHLLGAGEVNHLKGVSHDR